MPIWRREACWTLRLFDCRGLWYFSNMEMSIREAQARFSEAIAAVMRGERVVITSDGKPVAELNSTPDRQSLNFAAADEYLDQIGWDAEAMRLPDNFNDPGFSRKVLGIGD